MGPIIADGSRKVAVRVFLARWLSRIQFADELGGGMSRLNKSITASRDTTVVPPKDRELALANCYVLAMGNPVGLQALGGLNAFGATQLQDRSKNRLCIFCRLPFSSQHTLLQSGRS